MALESLGCLSIPACLYAQLLTVIFDFHAEREHLDSIKSSQIAFHVHEIQLSLEPRDGEDRIELPLGSAPRH
jgi:hypothetical protein